MGLDRIGAGSWRGFPALPGTWALGTSCSLAHSSAPCQEGNREGRAAASEGMGVV